MRFGAVMICHRLAWVCLSGPGVGCGLGYVSDGQGEVRQVLLSQGAQLSSAHACYLQDPICVLLTSLLCYVLCFTK